MTVDAATIETAPRPRVTPHPCRGCGVVRVTGKGRRYCDGCQAARATAPRPCRGCGVLVVVVGPVPYCPPCRARRRSPLRPCRRCGALAVTGIGTRYCDGCSGTFPAAPPCRACGAAPANPVGLYCDGCRTARARPAPPRSCRACGVRVVDHWSYCAGCRGARCPTCGGIGEHRVPHPVPRVPPQPREPRVPRNLVSDEALEGELVTSYPLALRVAASICGRRDAADAVQAACLGTWRVRAYLNPVPGIAFYFLTAVRRHALAAVRGEYARPLVMSPEMLDAADAHRRLGDRGRRIPPKLLSTIEGR